jgi:aromatic ring-opening dioxygenase catalytic subunit (LigB family)
MAEGKRKMSLLMICVDQLHRPCFFMDWTMGDPNTWDNMRNWLQEIGGQLLEHKPKAIVVVSAHWEEKVATVTTNAKPPMFYDYYGFPKHTYELSWPAAGAPDVAQRVRDLLKAKGIASAEDAKRGFDHGTFVPLLVAMPKAEIPTIQLSLLASLDPAAHIAIGQAIAPLRDEGVLIIGSGMSFHNMRAFSADSKVVVVVCVCVCLCVDVATFTGE